jgi:predicted TIM-barrel fold metal-dependent hydrolase
VTRRALISADNHVFEPPTLWQERLPKSFRSRGPRLEQQGEWHVMAIEGMPDRKLARVDGAQSDGGEAKRSHEAGFAAGGSDPDARLRDMALDGVVAEVIYPTFGLFIDMMPAPDLQMACAQVYNDWLAESFLQRPDVFIPSAVIPLRDVAAATAELERVIGLGFKAATIPTTPPEGTPYNQPVFDPLWKLAAGANLPLSLHTGTGALPQHERGPGGAVINYVKVGLLSAETLSYFAASGVLERFPALRLVFVETGAGWLAYCCERMDEAFEEHAQWVKPKLAHAPSEYVRRQCHVTLGADRAPLLTREITGIAPLLWASDYPHPEGTFPKSQQVVERIFAGVPEEEMNAIVHDNAARLYGVQPA